MSLTENVIANSVQLRVVNVWCILLSK